MDENAFGSCQPCSNNIHIRYDDNTTSHRATVITTGTFLGALSLSWKLVPPPPVIGWLLGRCTLHKTQL